MSIITTSFPSSLETWFPDATTIEFREIAGLGMGLPFPAKAHIGGGTTFHRPSRAATFPLAASNPDRERRYSHRLHNLFPRGTGLIQAGLSGFGRMAFQKLREFSMFGKITCIDTSRME